MTVCAIDPLLILRHCIFIWLARTMYTRCIFGILAGKSPNIRRVGQDRVGKYMAYIYGRIFVEATVSVSVSV